MNYLYNDIELPALPDWDKEQYPCAYISWTVAHSYWLQLLPVALVFSDNMCKTVDGSTVTSIGYTYTGDGDEWEGGDESTTYTGEYERALPFLKWSNTAVYNDDGSIYLSASDPIPVGVLTARDLYRKINGKPTKLTLYKKLGGKLVALDEHTKEVKT